MLRKLQYVESQSQVSHQIYFLEIYEIFNINNSSNRDYQMWFNQGISLEDSNFDMENSSSLVDVKKKLPKS